MGTNLVKSMTCPPKQGCIIKIQEYKDCDNKTKNKSWKISNPTQRERKSNECEFYY